MKSLIIEVKYNYKNYSNYFLKGKRERNKPKKEK